ncbi:hypothetical protein CLNEO_22210 [Anaerotignum neopropionicum]|uniref:DUF3793 family protein n=1 Tax=Anaerotignum neopropionicum TaxID=36847 RepID=A0A136WCQ6_9FIRM|nr:DUF3793 family protein [Anaerotignum neopropionicum]KXL52287.1 hypothetical protein CLNEO_22210 [Anaerotignum neopropionicum]
MSDFEMQMLYHGAPTLYGLKQANLFSLPLPCLQNLKNEVAAYQEQLEKKGISLQYLYCCSKRVFFLVYRKEKLLEYFSNPKIKDFLIKTGYPLDVNQEAALVNTLAFLRRRIQKCNDFPHEIGFFLGYPSEDVFAFIEEKGQNYKLCGYWKVYGDEKAAVATFQQYTNCRKKLLHQASEGIPILSLLEAKQTLQEVL